MVFEYIPLSWEVSYSVARALKRFNTALVSLIFPVKAIEVKYLWKAATIEILRIPSAG